MGFICIMLAMGFICIMPAMGDIIMASHGMKDLEDRKKGPSNQKTNRHMS